MDRNGVCAVRLRSSVIASREISCAAKVGELVVGVRQQDCHRSVESEYMFFFSFYMYRR